MGLFDFNCLNCKKKSSIFKANVGTGTTWSLTKCPHCGELRAKAYTGGFIPNEVLADPDITIDKYER
jgi:hypothetical protein